MLTHIMILTSSYSTDFFVKYKLNSTCVQLNKIFKIFLSVPVSSATGERSFSCLKLIKTHLRSVISQERLSDLSVLTLNKDLLEYINKEEVIDIFAEVKCRRLHLKY